jgi:hypothetical protein
LPSPRTDVLFSLLAATKRYEFGILLRGAKSTSPDGKTLVSAQEITVPAPPPHPFALMYAEEFQAGIAVVSDVETAKEVLRVGEVPRQPAQGQSK